MKSFLSVLFLVLAIVFAILYFRERSRFPVGLYICPSMGDCFISEMYESREDCEGSAMAEKGNWLCDSSDLSDIRCHVDPSRVISSYCK
jgi:hypothetical protein